MREQRKRRGQKRPLITANIPLIRSLAIIRQVGITPHSPQRIGGGSPYLQFLVAQQPLDLGRKVTGIRLAPPDQITASQRHHGRCITVCSRRGPRIQSREGNGRTVPRPPLVKLLVGWSNAVVEGHPRICRINSAAKLFIVRWEQRTWVYSNRANVQPGNLLCDRVLPTRRAVCDPIRQVRYRVRPNRGNGVSGPVNFVRTARNCQPVPVHFRPLTQLLPAILRLPLAISARNDQPDYSHNHEQEQSQVNASLSHGPTMMLCRPADASRNPKQAGTEFSQKQKKTTKREGLFVIPSFPSRPSVRNIFASIFFCLNSRSPFPQFPPVQPHPCSSVVNF